MAPSSSGVMSAWKPSIPSSVRLNGFIGSPIKQSILLPHPCVQHSVVPHAIGSPAPDIGRRAHLSVLFSSYAAWASTPAKADDYAGDLPSEFITLERKLIQAMRESIQVQQDGGTESEVRKSAENAKGPIKEFLGKWKTDQRVEGTFIWVETAKAIEELGQYYIRRGQRAALDKSTATSILRHLDAAEAVLPPEEEKKFFGLF